MTKQEEIREGIGVRLCGYGDDVNVENCKYCQSFQKPNICRMINKFISYLDSQGVRLLVDRGLPDTKYHSYMCHANTERVIRKSEQKRVLKAGYAPVERLIDE